MAPNDESLYETLFRMRDEYRRRAQAGISVVAGDELSWETSRQGKLKWFLHPAKEDTVIKNLLVWEQEIPPGSRTGKQHLPGGVAHYILEGFGYSLIDGVRYDWKEGDGIGLPVRPEGIICQHFNGSPDRPARFLAVMPNLIEALGVDLGSQFEQLEDAPNE